MAPEENLGITVRRWGRAWIALCFALALHVTDEALTDFLSVYNPTVRGLKSRWPFLPLPIFTFRAWLIGLILAVAILLWLSRYPLRGARWMIPFAYFFASLMFVNGSAHVAGSFYLHRLMPGVYSSPLLLIASVYLLRQTHRYHRRVARWLAESAREG